MVFAAKNDGKRFQYGDLGKIKERFPVSGHLSGLPTKATADPAHEDEVMSDDLYIKDDGPQSGQEEDLHKIRDRVRIRLHMIEYDF